MGDMTTTPARVHQSGSELELVATKFGGHLLAIRMNWTLGSPGRPDGRDDDSSSHDDSWGGIGEA